MLACAVVRAGVRMRWSTCVRAYASAHACACMPDKHHQPAEECADQLLERVQDQCAERHRVLALRVALTVDEDVNTKDQP